MKKNSKMMMALIGMAALAMGALAGCGSSGAQTARRAPAAAQTEAAAPAGSTAGGSTAGGSSGTDGTEADTAGADTAGAEQGAAAELSGSVSIVGSTSMEKFSNALSEVFMEKHPKVTVAAQFVGSGAGIEAVINGTADIGNASRELKEEEKAKGIIENIVAIDGIAVIVDPSNAVSDLTKEQLGDIYKGNVKNWKDVGGADAPIVVVGRESGSGTRSAFEELLSLEDACGYSNELDSTGAVMAKVASTPGSIGYVSLDVLDDTVKALELEGTKANEENIRAGSYFLSRPFVMATKGGISAQNDNVKALFDFIYSAKGSELVRSVGLIAVN